MAEYIEKQAAIEYLMINMGWHDEDGRSVDDAEEKRGIITDLINGIPTADVRPARRGRWEMDSDNIPHCTECGCVAPQRLFLQVQSLACTTQFIMSNFCLDCGSDMREEEKNENA